MKCSQLCKRRSTEENSVLKGYLVKNDKRQPAGNHETAGTAGQGRLKTQTRKSTPLGINAIILDTEKKLKAIPWAQDFDHHMCSVTTVRVHKIDLAKAKTTKATVQGPLNPERTGEPTVTTHVVRLKSPRNASTHLQGRH